MKVRSFLQRVRRTSALPSVVTFFALSIMGSASAGPVETVLYWFTGSDGANPSGGLISDSKGNLFGMTQSGGGAGVGTVFKLSPPATPGGTWTETTLYSFCSLANCSDGASPPGGHCR